MICSHGFKKKPKIRRPLLKEYDKPGYPAGHIANGSVIVIKDHLVYIKDYILYVSRNYHKTKFKLWQPPYVEF